MSDSPDQSLIPAPPPPPPGPQAEESRSYTQTAQGRLTVAPLALSLIALGGGLLWQNVGEGPDISPPLAILIVLGGLAGTFFVRFFTSGRRERGLFFLATSLLALGGLGAIFSFLGDDLALGEGYPLFLLAPIAALVLGFVVEREHERGLLRLAFILAVSLGAALLLSLGLLSESLQGQISDFFPLALALIGISLIPLALRRPATDN
jgi:FtsH-binding integral membrane protein